MRSKNNLRQISDHWVCLKAESFLWTVGHHLHQQNDSSWLPATVCAANLMPNITLFDYYFLPSILIPNHWIEWANNLFRQTLIFSVYALVLITSKLCSQPSIHQSIESAPKLRSQLQRWANFRLKIIFLSISWLRICSFGCTAIEIYIRQVQSTCS